MKFLQWLKARFYCLILGHWTGFSVRLNPIAGPQQIEVCRRCDKEWVRS